MSGIDEKAQIFYVGWEITNACDLDCEFCYSFMFQSMKELSTPQFKEGISNLRSLGVQGLNFCGGEPLLRNDLAELVAQARLVGLATMLSTNGNRIVERISELAPALDWIVLPLDGATADMHDFYRGTGNYQRVLNALRHISQTYPQVKIKINTVVTQHNVDHLVNVGKLLSDYRVKWKVIQFSPRGRAEHRRRQMELDDAAFHLAGETLVRSLPTIDIDVSPNGQRNNGCVVLNQRGDILSPENEKYHLLGNIFDLKQCSRLMHESIASATFVPTRNLSILEASYQWRIN